MLPRAYPHVMANNYVYAAENGVSAHYAEIYPNWGEGPKPWISLKLQWDPYQDVDELLDQWYERAVGAEAAPYLREYYDHWEQFWTERIKQSDWFEARKSSTYLNFNDPSYLNLVTEEEIAYSRNLLENVVSLAETDQQKGRGEILLQAFEYYEASALSYAKILEPITEESAALALLDEDRIDREMQYAQKRYDLIDQFNQHPVLVPTFDLASRPLLNWTGLDPYEFWALAHYVETYEPNGGAVTQAVNEIASGKEATKTREFAQMLQEVNHKMFPLNENMSFENLGGIAPWSAWVKNNPESGSATMERTEERSRSGDASLLISNLDRGGPHQLVQVKPGLLAAQVYYYTEAGTETDAVLRLSFNLMDKNRTALGNISSDVKSVKDTAGTWASIGFLVDIPETMDGVEVAIVQTVITIDNVEQGTKLYLDDMEVYQANRDFVTLQSYWMLADHIQQHEPIDGPMRQRVVAAADSDEPSSERDLARLLLRTIDGDTSLTYNVNTTEGNVVKALRVFDSRPADAVFSGPAAARLYYKVPEGTDTDGTFRLSINVYTLENSTPGATGVVFRSIQRPLSDSDGEWAYVDLVGIIPEEVQSKRLQIVISIAGHPAGQTDIEVGTFELYVDGY